MIPRSAEAIAGAVAQTGLLTPPAGAPGPLLLLCSPGRDSACLLDLAVGVLGPAGVHVLHVDHGLRAESGAEAAFVQEAAAARGVGVTVRSANDAAGGIGSTGDTGSSGGSAPPAAGNLHAWARDARRQLAEREAARLGAWGVATAHTRTDLVETAIFRLSTQPGRRALLAMRGRERSGIAPGVDLVRPLLGVGRDETLAWCRARGLRWLDDPSNADRRFARARLRHSVTPVLRGLNPRFEEAVVRTLGELEEERAALDAIVAQTLPPGADALPIEALEALPRAIGRLVLRELCERAVGAPCPRATARLDELLARAAADRAPFQLDVGEGARLEVRRGVVRCTSSSGPAAPHARP
jgi:tRNA(Ile)-lysidine synthase